MKDVVKGKTALVTGAGQGIGADTALALAEQGASKIALLDINEPGMADNEKKIKAANPACEVYVQRLDVSDTKAICDTMKTINDRFGKIDIAANIAGIGKNTPLFDLSLEDWDRTLAVNLTGLFVCCREQIRYMKETGGGSIINMSSKAGQDGGQFSGADYVASKAGVIGLTKYLARQVAQYKIRVNSIAPGSIKTDISAHQVLAPGSIPLTDDNFAPVRDVSDAVLYLGSEMSNFVTGSCLNISGGVYMH